MEKIILPGFDRDEAAAYQAAAAKLDAFREGCKASAVRLSVKERAAAILLECKWKRAAPVAAEVPDAQAYLDQLGDAPEVDEATARRIVEDLKAAA